MSDLIYLDYNSTSPLANSVKEYLQRGDFFYANPASQHSLGKKSRHAVNKAATAIKEHFQWDHSLVFHSGASEAISSVIASLNANEDCLVFFSTDHAVVLEAAKDFQSKGGAVYEISVDKSGKPVVAEIEKIDFSKYKTKLLNFTWANNETGICWPLEWAISWKSQWDLTVHVDAVQTVGKLKNANHLAAELDFYTFSGHKFGALKGVGFTFFKESFPIFIFGGGQQKGNRGGTENLLGVQTMALALEESYPYQKVEELKESLVQLLSDHEKVHFYQFDSSLNQLCNTLCFSISKLKPEIILAKLDLLGLEVSLGAACSSGTFKGSRVLKSMGHNDYLHAVRVSLGPENLSQADQILTQFKKFLDSL